MKLIKSGKIDSRCLIRCSEELKELVLKILEIDPKERPNAKELLNDPYFINKNIQNN